MTEDRTPENAEATCVGRMKHPAKSSPSPYPDDGQTKGEWPTIWSLICPAMDNL